MIARWLVASLPGGEMTGYLFYNAETKGVHDNDLIVV